MLQIIPTDPKRSEIISHLTIRASLAPRDAIFYYAIFTQGQKVKLEANGQASSKRSS